MKSGFKYKIGDIVYHRADEECGFVVITRLIIEGVSGGESPWYYCNNLVYGMKLFAEIELTLIGG